MSMPTHHASVLLIADYIIWKFLSWKWKCVIKIAIIVNAVQCHSLLFTRSLWLSGVDCLMTHVHKRSYMPSYQNNKICQKPWKMSTKKSIRGGLRCFVWQLLKQPSWPWAGRQAAPHSETKRAFRTQLTHLWTLAHNRTLRTLAQLCNCTLVHKVCIKFTFYTFLYQSVILKNILTWLLPRCI